MKNLFNKLRESIKKKPVIWGASFAGFALICTLGIILAVNLLGDDTIIGDPDRRRPVVVNTDDGDISDDFPDEPVEDISLGRTASPDISSLLTSVTAVKTSGRVVETDTAFYITTAEDISADELKRKLVLEASSALDFSLEFELSKAGESNFLLKSASPLPEDSIVRLALLNDDGEVERRWAFQTAAIFKITSTLPGDEGEWVPVDTGIEINFSVEVNPSAISDYFSIEPSVEGRFQRFRNTIVFVPAKDLEIDTVYKVTVSAGLPSADGLILEEGRTFSFRTRRDSGANHFYTGGGISETFLPGDPAVLEVYCSQELGDRFEVKLYQFSGADAYRTELNNYINGSSWGRDYIFSTTGLSEVYSSTDSLMRANADAGHWRPAYLLLPDNLAEGYYIAEAKTTHRDIEYSVQKLIQINPISVYASSLPNESLFFINDTGTGLAAGNAAVSVNVSGKTTSGRADANGIARVEIAAENRGRGIISIEHGGHLYLDLFNCRQYTERTPEENYFLHLYTDRETYKTTDEIYVWGVVIPRERGIPLPTDVYLQVGEDTMNAPVPVTLRADGTFTALINVQNNVETWWYPIFLMSGDEVMARKRITIRDYVTPAYVFDIDVPFYAWLPYMNPVDVSLTASFFEGTPAKDLDFFVNCWNAVESKAALVTDEKGYTETTFLMIDNPERNFWRPRRIDVVFELSGIENEYQRKTGSFFGLFRDVMLESDYSAGTLNIATSMVDPTNFVPREQKDTTSYYGYNYGGGWYDYYDYYYYYDDYLTYDSVEILRGAPVNVTVTGTLTRHWSDRIESGSYYDFIQKRNVTSYRYESRSETVGTYTINTANGIGAFTNLPVNIPGSSYRMALQWHDTQGQLVEETIYLYERSNYFWGDETIHSYNLVADSRTFTENQSLNLQLTDNGQPVTEIPANARIFFTVSGSEFIRSGTVNSPEFSHRMTADYIPNARISGAYFNGRHIFPIAVNQYFFDSSEREIIIEVTTDRDKYSPSDSARVTITARDLQGRVVPDARVSLSVVDEAAFAVQDQRINTLSMLYAYIYTPWVESYYSYIQHSLFGYGPGEKGGGGDSDTLVRRNFKDNAAFLTGTTDSSGRVTFNIDLPDNLTSWRLTAQVVGNNADGVLCAGNTKEPLIVTLPLFLTVNSLPEYIEGDDITVSARVNGTVSGSPQITARITGNGVDKTATAYSDQALSFGKLPLGMYTLLVSTRDGVNSDAVELPLEVVKSLLEVPLVNTFNLIDGIEGLNPLRYPVSLTFYDTQCVLYSEVLSYLYRSWGDRVDFRVARAFAQLELEHIDDKQFNELLVDIFTSESFIRLLPYGDRELPLTAMLCAAAPDVVNRGAMTRLFYNVVSQTPDSRKWNSFYTSAEITHAYLALAALGEPVLTDIQGLLEDPAGLVLADKLRLCAALAMLGDEHNALKHYLELTEELYAEFTDSRTRETHVRIRDDDITALSLLTAGALNLPEADGMVRYLMSRTLTDRTFVLELMAYLRHYNPQIEGTAEFSYNLYGRTETVMLNRFRGVTLSFGKEQLENADFKVLSGDVGVKAYYIGDISDVTDTQALTVRKTYTLENGGDWVPGALVRVTVTVSGASDRMIFLNDVIPSGARFAGMTENRHSWVYRSLQRVSGARHTRNGSTITYLIRLVNSGEFVTESAVVSDSRGNWGMSERGTIIIE